MIDIKVIDDITDRIAKFLKPDKIILFGSYAYGTPSEDSDIDFFVIKDSDIPRPERSISLRKVLFGTMLPMDIIVYTNDEVNKSMDSKNGFVYQVMTKGRVLYERES